jgi:hypothetical protein
VLRMKALFYNVPRMVFEVFFHQVEFKFILNG